MFKQFFQRLKYRRMARQLRHPSGKRGHNTGLMMNKANEFLYRHLISLVKPVAEQHLLEIGFGNGKFFGMLMETIPGLVLSGIDYSTLMVEEAIKENELSVKAGKLHLVQGNSNCMPFADNSFDAVFCINVIYFWDDAGAHLQEVKRVLKPGGRFYATIRTKESMKMMPFANYGFTMYDQAEWQQLVQKNGLQFLQAVRIDEPEIMYQDKKVSIQSICLVAAKP